jgi:hypothetical protein
MARDPSFRAPDVTDDFVRITANARISGVVDRPARDLADIRRCCYDPRSGDPRGRLIPALGDRLMVGLQTLTLPV